jgi:hypothetical protein
MFFPFFLFFLQAVSVLYFSVAVIQLVSIEWFLAGRKKLFQFTFDRKCEFEYFSMQGESFFSHQFLHQPNHNGRSWVRVFLLFFMPPHTDVDWRPAIGL